MADLEGLKDTTNAKSHIAVTITKYIVYIRSKGKNEKCSKIDHL